MKMRTVLGWVGVFALISQSNAGVFCVQSSEELSSALAQAGVNGQADEIRIVPGTYQVPDTQGFRYFENPSENFPIEISGGWLSILENCNFQSRDAYSTTLDGNGQFRILEVVPNTDTDVTISHLNFINGFRTGPAANSGNNGGGLSIRADHELNGEITIENNTFINNQAFGAGALLVRDAEKVTLRNNLFAANVTESGDYVVNVSSTDQTGFYITNNTIMQNSGGMYVAATGTTQAFLANNLIWSNNDSDLQLLGASDHLFLYNNNFEFSTGSIPLPANQSGNITADPILDPGILSFTPSITSPLVSAGRNAPFVVPTPTPFQFLWTEGAFDFEGNTRNRGSRIDIGAVESPHQMPLDALIFRSGFE